MSLQITRLRRQGFERSSSLSDRDVMTETRTRRVGMQRQGSLPWEVEDSRRDRDIEFETLAEDFERRQGGKKRCYLLKQIWQSYQCLCLCCLQIWLRWNTTNIHEITFPYTMCSYTFRSLENIVKTFQCEVFVCRHCSVVCAATWCEVNPDMCEQRAIYLIDLSMLESAQMLRPALLQISHRFNTHISGIFIIQTE